MGYIANLNDLIREDLDGQGRTRLVGQDGGSQKRAGGLRPSDGIAKPQTFYHGTKDDIHAFEGGHQNQKYRAKAKSGLVAILRYRRVWKPCA